MTICKSGVVSFVDESRITIQCDGATYQVPGYLYARRNGRGPMVHESVDVLFAPSGGVVRVRPVWNEHNRDANPVRSTAMRRASSDIEMARTYIVEAMDELPEESKFEDVRRELDMTLADLRFIQSRLRELEGK